MTTIVYRDGVMAADTRLVLGSLICPGGIHKIAKTKKGALVGCAGSADNSHAFLAWADGKRTEDPPKDDDADGLIVEPDGSILMYDGNGIFPVVNAPFAACGSGARVAVGAMAMGATALEAMRIAMRCDVYTGGDIDLLTLGDD